ncbi:NAD(P)-binding protein [Zopfia rhizophila CBS 207.26]|uniref:NAD(P)-binding protein n=1 Tax=Zopfia rhizophila CBS 207.26 TaxID=1314779 RepID=A0A6A6E5X1_9PEZI|nr:NAD(P)-binding protein [Zopfia rhizophila CBS 207.26]
MAASIDPNMLTAPFQLTASMHRDIYSAVDPKSPALRVDGKVVLITGAGGGLGYLENTAASLNVPALVAPCDVTSESDIASVFEKGKRRFEKVDVVVNTAGTVNVNGVIGEIDPRQWWVDFETNVKGTYNLFHHFLNTTEGKGTFINLISLGASMLAPGISSYSTAKLAAIKLAEYFDLEHPKLRIFSLHPGVVEAENGCGMVIDHLTPFAKDKAALTAGVTLYLQRPEADFLRGGFVSVNWDIKEMERHKDEILDEKLLKLGFLRAKLGPYGHPWSK